MYFRESSVERVTEWAFIITKEEGLLKSTVALAFQQETTSFPEPIALFKGKMYVRSKWVCILVPDFEFQAVMVEIFLPAQGSSEWMKYICEKKKNFDIDNAFHLLKNTESIQPLDIKYKEIRGAKPKIKQPSDYFDRKNSNFFKPPESEESMKAESNDLENSNSSKIFGYIFVEKYDLHKNSSTNLKESFFAQKTLERMNFKSFNNCLILKVEELSGIMRNFATVVPYQVSIIESDSDFLKLADVFLSPVLGLSPAQTLVKLLETNVHFSMKMLRESFVSRCIECLIDPKTYNILYTTFTKSASPSFSFFLIESFIKNRKRRIIESSYSSIKNKRAMDVMIGRLKKSYIQFVMAIYDRFYRSNLLNQSSALKSISYWIKFEKDLMTCFQSEVVYDRINVLCRELKKSTENILGGPTSNKRVSVVMVPKDTDILSIYSDNEDEDILKAEASADAQRDQKEPKNTEFATSILSSNLGIAEFFRWLMFSMRISPSQEL